MFKQSLLGTLYTRLESISSKRYCLHSIYESQSFSEEHTSRTVASVRGIAIFSNINKITSFWILLSIAIEFLGLRLSKMLRSFIVCKDCTTMSKRNLMFLDKIFKMPKYSGIDIFRHKRRQVSCKIFKKIIFCKICQFFTGRAKSVKIKSNGLDCRKINIIAKFSSEFCWKIVVEKILQNLLRNHQMEFGG